MSVDWYTYIKSPEWKAKRQERLEIDGHCCVVCKRGGIRLEVHHLTYERLGNEDVQNDLVTVCVKHHHHFDNIERWHRYERRQHKIEQEAKSIIRRDTSNGMARSDLQIDLSGPYAHAQRPDCRSYKQMGEGNEAD